MDWLDKMNGAIGYIEAHLLDDIDYCQVAKMACCSVYHFQRLFSFITDIPISEYIRRRRLSLAAFELQSSDVKVLDVALKYGYESPEAFARAFKNLHGIMPTAARAKGAGLKAYPRISFHISIKGDTEMNYRIEEKPAFEMMGLSADIDSAAPYTEIPAFWKKCIREGLVDRMHKDCGIGEKTLLHGSLFNFRDGVFSYMICYDMPKSGMLDGYERLSLPAQTWAVFPTGEYGADECQKTHEIWKRIGSEWFPTSNYEHVDGPEFEMFYNLGDNRFMAEVWIPVVKK